MNTKNGYEILLIGDVYDNHLKRLINNLKKCNPEAIVDVLSFYREDEDISNVQDNIRRIYYIKPLNNHFIGIPILSTLSLIYNIKIGIKQLKGNRYDCVNIHFPYWLWNTCLKEFHALTDNLMLSPWGSDVYRIGKKEQKRLTKLYKAAKFISCSGNRFQDDVKKKFNVADNKFVFLKIGSETIDCICKNKETTTTEDAKKALGISGLYAITCGYNGSPAQRHVDIINAIISIRKALPQKLVLLFPVTYLHNDTYIQTLKNKLNDNNITGLFFESYLSLEGIFLVRQATDMFIHVQTTDAANSSLKEYILLKKTCINGSWLKYIDLEKYKPLPYYEVDSMSSLGDTIIKAYLSDTVSIPTDVCEYISSLGWNNCIKDWDNFFKSLIL